MQIHKTALPDVLIIEPKVRGEETALRKRFVAAEQLEKLVQPLSNGGYGRYQASLITETVC